MSRSLINAAAVLALPALGLFGLAPSADAAVIYGLTENNNVFRIDSDIPETIQSGVFVQGLEGAELLNIDFRPSTGQEPIRDEVLRCLGGRPSILMAKEIGDRIIQKMKEYVEVFVVGMAA